MKKFVITAKIREEKVEVYEEAPNIEHLWNFVQHWEPEDFGFQEPDEWDLEIILANEDGSESIETLISARLTPHGERCYIPA